MAATPTLADFLARIDPAYAEFADTLEAAGFKSPLELSLLEEADVPAMHRGAVRLIKARAALLHGQATSQQPPQPPAPLLGTASTAAVAAGRPKPSSSSVSCPCTSPGPSPNSMAEGLSPSWLTWLLPPSCLPLPRDRGSGEGELQARGRQPRRPRLRIQYHV